MTPEGKISRDIKVALGALPGLLLLRNTVGKHHMPDEKNNQVRTIVHGLGTGSPDFVSILKTPKGLGVWFCLEVKAPGKKRSEDQERCTQIWQDAGALVYVVTSAEEARTALADARLKISV